MSTSTLSAEQSRFIEDLAALLVTWTMPANAARLYGYLQLRCDPVTLDDIARDLEISRSYAFNAARILETHGNARRLTERGSKRVLFIAGEDPGAPLRHQTETLGKMSALIAAQKDTVSEGTANGRLTRLARFHHDLKQAMESVILPDGQPDAV
ncbi:MAG TPA: hypothetical protein VF503_32470 [Sphingobium sp.]|uniref:GbsR/MarR family transcriptional regulator n=1 Tax=Sphingobium sp. TaxID=1912891 RepID=UPI002ED3C7D4